MALWCCVSWVNDGFHEASGRQWRSVTELLGRMDSENGEENFTRWDAKMCDDWVVLTHACRSGSCRLIDAHLPKDVCSKCKLTFVLSLCVSPTLRLSPSRTANHFGSEGGCSARGSNAVEAATGTARACSFRELLLGETAGLQQFNAQKNSS
eukprot:20953-Rhodomonas_salina.1